ncbi:MAG: C39 family peptidase [Melioribacteraceae bacterium]|nr:C39 family peptidase [Melioribacteraceae bacterium]
MNVNLLISLLFFICSVLFAQVYPDQFYELRIDSLKNKIETSSGVKLSNDGKSFVLEDNVLDGFIIFKEQTSQFPFNQGLPSYNGKVYDNQSGFKVQMRFPYGSGWSDWLTVGYWQTNIWNNYGLTAFNGGYIDVDYVKLTSYTSKWQFKVILTRNSLSSKSPSIHKISFFVNDSKTTSNVNVAQIVNDNPKEIFIPTSFIYQYGVDPVIGKDICSPTTVSMILRSYNIQVDPYQFAVTTYDSYHKMFGVWPRVVQNAAEYGLDGAVTRYRTWSETRKVLEAKGRIAMSLGSPLYPNGHLVMLAGFTNDGKVIVHDPAKSNGNSYIHDKTNLTQSWFAKGGISYTFYNPNNITSVENISDKNIFNSFELYQNYPNPFNPSTTISYFLTSPNSVQLKIYDVLGNEITTLVHEFQEAGNYKINFDGSNLSNGVYIYRLIVGNNSLVKKMILMK